MNDSLVSARYAKALMNFAIKEEKEEVVYSEMKSLANSYLKHPKFSHVLENPIVSMSDKIKLIHAAAGGNVSYIFKKFIDIVVANRREMDLLWIALSFRDLYRETKHIYYGKLITVVPFGDAVSEKLQNVVLHGRTGTVEFDTVIDDSIIGGFIFECDSNRIDASVQDQIRRIRKEFVERNKRIV
ncbi:MAG: F0F1 ATP synthase subunit delta [Bacteroidales bacterium]|nr:F0F1 ATP synthase subunit delta [Bacteroidales bacterium]